MPRVGRPRVRRTACFIACLASAAHAAEPQRAGERSSASETADRFSFTGQSETTVQLFRRALLPGANGTLVTTRTEAPVHEYLFAGARDVDVPWQKDGLDLEVSAWGRVWPTASGFERPFDGDVQTANVRLRGGPTWVRLGRQQIAGGAARFARFDGAMAGVNLDGLFLEGYGGLSVLPRWDERPGYYQLGSAEGELLKLALPPPERQSQWLAGARFGYATSRVSGSVSFHEQRETRGVERRNLGLDVGAEPFSELRLGTSALLELDSGRFAQARLFADATPLAWLSVDAEALRAEPALLLSRQSVLSVFTTDGYEELGGMLGVRALAWLRFEGSGYVEAYDGGRPGARTELATRFGLERERRTLVRLAYARVIAPGNGYHSARVSLGRELWTRVAATLEAYAYFYDQRVAGYATSSVYAGTLSYHAFRCFDLLWGASLARSPYAALDAQTLLRATLAFDGPARGRYP